MGDLQATLAAIDEVAVHACGWCQRPLADDGPSPDFCGDVCQHQWTQRRHEVVELTGYREPLDIPAHVWNQREQSSPETTPGGVGRFPIQPSFPIRPSFPAVVQDPGVGVAISASEDFELDVYTLQVRDGDETATVTMTGQMVGQSDRRDLERLPSHIASARRPGQTLQQAVDEVVGYLGVPRRVVLGHRYVGGEVLGTLELRAALHRGTLAPARLDIEQMRAVLNAYRGILQGLGERIREVGRSFCRTWLNEAHEAEPITTPEPDPMRRALEARRNRNTGPAQQQRAPRRIDPRRQR
jgi:hypothetical protein